MSDYPRDMQDAVELDATKRLITERDELRTALATAEREREEAREELKLHVDIDQEPATQEELDHVEQLRAAMKRTVEEYDIHKAIQRAEQAEAALATAREETQRLKALVRKLPSPWQPVDWLIDRCVWCGASDVRTPTREPVHPQNGCLWAVVHADAPSARGEEGHERT